MSFPKFLLYTFKDVSAKSLYFSAQISVTYFTPSKFTGSAFDSTSDIELESFKRLSYSLKFLSVSKTKFSSKSKLISTLL